MEQIINVLFAEKQDILRKNAKKMNVGKLIVMKNMKKFGFGNIWGPIIGSSILIPISEFSRIYFGGTGRSIDLIIYGILIILICIFRPSGIVSLIPRSFREREKVK